VERMTRASSMSLRSSRSSTRSITLRAYHEEALAVSLATQSVTVPDSGPGPPAPLPPRRSRLRPARAIPPNRDSGPGPPAPLPHGDPGLGSPGATNPTATPAPFRRARVTPPTATPTPARPRHSPQPRFRVVSRAALPRGSE
jgi:hypothetical protein